MIIDIMCAMAGDLIIGHIIIIVCEDPMNGGVFDKANTY